MDVTAQIDELKARFDSAETVEELKSIKTEIDNLNQVLAEGKDAFNALEGMKMAEPTAEIKTAPATLGDHIVSELKAAGYTAGQRDAFKSTEFKAAGDTLTVGNIPEVQKRFNIGNPVMLRDLFPVIPISGNAYIFQIEGAFAADFGVVAQDGQKPYVSDGNLFTSSTKALDTVAGLMKVSNQLLEDYPALAAAVNARGIAKMMAKENGKIVSEIANTSGIQTYNGTTDPVSAIETAAAMVQAATEYGADGIIMHPETWASMRVAKGSDGHYVGAGAFGNDGPRLWGYPVITSAACAKNKVYVGAFAVSGEVVTKGGNRIDIAYENGTDFEKNRATIRVEERMAFALVKPAGVVEVTI